MRGRGWGGGGGASRPGRPGPAAGRAPILPTPPPAPAPPQPCCAVLFVAVAAQALARNGEYEIPFHKKQAARAQQQLSDLERKKGEAQRSAAAAAADFRQECQALGVDPGRLRTSLLGLAAELPGLLAAAVGQLRSEELTEAVRYYRAIVEAVTEGGGEPGALLPTLEEVRAGTTAPPAELPAAEAAAGGDGYEDAAGASIEWDLGGAAGEAGVEQEAGAGDSGGGVAASVGTGRQQT